MKHVNKFIDTNLLNDEISRLQDLRDDLKRKNAMYRTRLCRLQKIRDDLEQGDFLKDAVKAGED